MDINTGSSLPANGLSQIEVLVLRNELFALRDRVANLERQLANIKQSEHRFEETCVFCHELHSIRHCDYFKYLQVTDRWNVAKKLNLCYRCLEKSHHGLDCLHTKKCGVNRCRLTHHELLHNEEKRKNRKRAKHEESTGPFEPPGGDSIQDQSGATLTDSQSELSDMTPKSVYGEFQEMIRRSHAGTTDACDGDADGENMDELNRLAMLAETDVKIPFDIVFGGSCGNELGSSQSRNLISNSFAGKNCEENKFSKQDRPGCDENIMQASFYGKGESDNENVDPAVKRPCPVEVVVNFDPENGYETDSSGVNSLDPIAPGGNDPFRPSGGNLNVTSTVPPLENENITFAPDGIDINARLYDAGMFYNKCRMPADYHNGTEEETEEKYLEIPSGDQTESANCTRDHDSIDSKSETPLVVIS